MAFGAIVMQVFCIPRTFYGGALSRFVFVTLSLFQFIGCKNIEAGECLICVLKPVTTLRLALCTLYIPLKCLGLVNILLGGSQILHPI